MSIALITLGGFGNGTVETSIPFVVNMGYSIGVGWVDASTNNSVWSSQVGETIWDDGNTVWDLEGNVNMTRWDVDETTWSDEAQNSTTWNDA